MRLPNRNIGPFVAELIQACSASRADRVQRGAYYRGMYLSGSTNSDIAVYNKTNTYIDTLGSYLFSPVELRYTVNPKRWASPSIRAQAKTVAEELNDYIADSDTDREMGLAVKWALIKGKSFIKMGWEGGPNGTFKGRLVQPELMAVLQEGKRSLDDQEMFVESRFITPDDFYRLVENHPNRKELMRKVRNHYSTGSAAQIDESNGDTLLKSVIVGGLYPYQAAGASAPQNNTRGQVDWVSGPAPQVAPMVKNRIIRLDTAWIKDDEHDGLWTTIQIVGHDCVIIGKNQRINAFADSNLGAWEKLGLRSEHNPLRGRHPFVEFCPNPLDGYFFGRSEICNIVLLQLALNARIDGINQLLRMQEKPPYKITGSAGVTQNIITKINRPNGYFTDSSPAAAIQSLAPELPASLFESLQQIIGMFDDMGGFTPLMQGRGEAGVRAQAHAETLVRTASPRFKDRAIDIERSAAEVGALGVQMLKAYVPEELSAWLPTGAAGEAAKATEESPAFSPPAPGMKREAFQYYHLDESCRVKVDAHSSSPAFSQEAWNRVLELARAKAISGEFLLEHSGVTDAGEAIAELETSKAAEAAFLAAHPEAATGGKKKK